MSSGRFKGRIKGPLKKVNNEQTTQEEYNKSWALLSEAFHEIHRRNAGSYTFEELYRNAYQIVLNKNAEKLHAGFRQIVTEHLHEVNRTQLDRPYQAIQLATTQHSAQLELQEARLAFLKAIYTAWEFHLVCMGMMSDVLRYMDKVAFREPKLPLVYDVGLVLWRDQILRQPEHLTGQKMTEVILDMIEDERRGVIINRALLKNILDMLQTLSAHGGAEVSETAYNSDFENNFLQRSRQFYEQEAARLSQDLSASEYLAAADKRLQEEQERTSHYLSIDTAPRIRAVVEHEMIAAYMTTILDMTTGMAFMLRQDRFTDLAMMFRLFARVDATTELFNNSLTAQIVSGGDEINTATNETAAEKPGERMSTTAQALHWVEDVLELRSKYDKVLLEAFVMDKNIANTITKAFTLFINKNHRSAEFISLYIDENLKKGLKGKTEQEVDDTLDKTVSLFRYVNDKDVFERYYKTHLAKRLLNERSLSNDAERGMIAKLKIEVGSTFTSRMEGMFKDIRLSEDLMRAFKASDSEQSSSSRLDINVSVLTSTFWPISSTEVTSATCQFPTQVEQRKSAFQSFYLGRHSGRMLNWLPSQGTAELRTQLGKRRYDLNVSTYAMAVLLQFNEIEAGSSLGFLELLSLTSIQEADLMRTLQSLACAKYKILNKDPKSKDVRPTDRFSVNEGFICPNTKIKIATIANKVETDTERKDTFQRIEENRQHQTEACIVRTMKARKQMDYNNLIAEVTKQLSSKFSPDPTMIKRRIEALIERDYLERDENDRRLYKYLA